MSAWQGRARSGILELYGGRFLKQTDIDNNSYVVVITRDTATELLGRADAVGESIKLNGKSFLVIGVLDHRGQLPYPVLMILIPTVQRGLPCSWKGIFLFPQ